MDTGDTVVLGAPVAGRYYVYGLCHPASNAVAYIGSTNRPAARLSAHLESACTGQVKGVAAWVRSITDQGMVPHMTILSTHLTMSAAVKAEYALIRHKRAEWPLVNYHGSSRHKQKRGPVTEPRSNLDGRLTISDVARILGVTRQRVHQLIKATGVTPSRFGPIMALSTGDIERLRAHRAPLGRPRKLTIDTRSASA